MVLADDLIPGLRPPLSVENLGHWVIRFECNRNSWGSECIRRSKPVQGSASDSDVIMGRVLERELTMPNFGPTELIIILLIALLLFGVGRLGRLGGELGRGIREFRKGIKEDETPEANSADEKTD